MSASCALAISLPEPLVPSGPSASTAEQNNAADSGWTEPFRLLFKDQESPPIRHYRITKNDLRTSTLWIALQGLNANPKI